MQIVTEAHPTPYFEGILQLVDCIYATACNEARWEQTVAQIQAVGKLESCALSMVDRLERRRVVLASYGPGSSAEPAATLGPPPGNPLLTDRILQSTPGAVWQDRQIMSDALPTVTLLWTDWMQSNGLTSWACVVVGRDEGHVVCLEVFAGPGRHSSCPQLDDFLRRLAPHLTRAWRLGRMGWPMLAAGSGDASPSHADGDSAPAPDSAGLPEVIRLRAEFGLTKAEARVALRLAEGASLATAAQAFNVKLTTIRSQLQQVFAKTGTARQTELVALLLNSGYGARRPLSPPDSRGQR